MTMARPTPHVEAISRFTPLLESGSGLRSRTSERGRPVYKGVTIIKAGLGNARDRNFYPASTLETAVKDGRFHGLRAYADHPDSVSEEIQPERTIRDMVGVYDNARFVKEGQGGRVVADLHLFRSAKWLSDTVDDLLDLGQADKIGLSINGRGKTVEKQLTLAEAADPINVNWVESFLTLRSSDVVTEAGAGGGFQHLLESARGTSTKENLHMKRLTKQQKASLAEAVATGDPTKIQAVMKECGCGMAEAEAPKKKKAPADADADDRDDEDEDALDAAHDDVVAEADPEEGDEDADPADEAEEDDADEDADEDEDAEADPDAVAEADADEDDEAAGDGQHKLGGAAQRIRAAAKGREAREAKNKPIKGGAGVLIKARKQMNTRGPGKGKTAVNMPANRGKQNGGQPGRRFGEASTLTRENERLREQNARLSSQLRVRTTADRARNLLRESAIPEKMRPDVLRLMVGKSEDEMTRIVGYHERLISSAIEEATSGEYSTRGVEGAGSRMRESYGGGKVSDFTSLLDEVGIPTKD